MAERQANPYRPGFNQAPLVLAGRETVLAGAREALEVAAHDGRTPRPLILVGPRGLGKTVTLGEIAGIAEADYSWVTTRVEAKAGSSLIDELQRRLGAARTLLESQEPSVAKRRRTRVTGGHIGATAMGLEASLDFTTLDAADEDLLTTLQRACEAAMARPGAGILITLDELHNAESEAVGEFAASVQEAVGHHWPLVVAMAALPTLRTAKGPRRLPTYLERAEWHVLDDLNDNEALDALIGPASQAGRPIHASAAKELLSISGGYPYAIQLAGHHAWRASHGHPEITRAHARAARPAIQAELETLFQGRWDDASPKERGYLRALAELTLEGDAPGGAAVAGRLGEGTHAVSYLRDRLLKKGTIYADAGGLYFITPGMAKWICDTYC